MMAVTQSNSPITINHEDEGTTQTFNRQLVSELGESSHFPRDRRKSIGLSETTDQFPRVQEAGRRQAMFAPWLRETRFGWFVVIPLDVKILTAPVAVTAAGPREVPPRTGRTPREGEKRSESLYPPKDNGHAVIATVQDSFSGCEPLVSRRHESNAASWITK